MIKHPITGEAFDYEHACGTCRHFTDKKRTVNKVKVRETSCSQDPAHRELANIDGTMWKALPACTLHQPR